MPTPDLSALKDDVGTLPLSDDILPAAMQAIHYFTEMMQYEQLLNPQADVPVTTPKPATTGWAQKLTTKWTQKPTTKWTQKPTTKWTQNPTTWWWTEKPSTTRQTTAKPITTEKPVSTTSRPSTVTQRLTTQKPFTTKTTRKPSAQQDFPYTTEINIWRETFFHTR